MKLRCSHRAGIGAIVIAGLFSVIFTACGGPSATKEMVSGPTKAVRELPTAAPADTPKPTRAHRGGDTVTIVTGEEPDALGAASVECRDGIHNMVCNDLTSDPLTWIDGTNFEVVPLSPIESWAQLEPARWRFKLRDGVTFHNGAPWNAEQAKFWIDYFGVGEGASPHYYDFIHHGEISGEIVDRLTLDVLCGKPCPILPRTTTFTKFQDARWFSQLSEDEIRWMTIGLGPYEIVEWRPGVEVELQAFAGYKPNAALASRAPSIDRVIQQWSNGPKARAAMLEAGQADWAEIDPEDKGRVAKFEVSNSNEAYVYAIDTMHHRELRKVEVREALNLAIDCPSLMEQIYSNLMACHGNIAQPGTVGITAENSAPYPYDPDRARKLLEEADYDTGNQVLLYIRPGTVYKDLAYVQAVLDSWRSVGINAEISEVKPEALLQIGWSNCGHTGTREELLNVPGGTLEDKCRIAGPGPSFYHSMNITAIATATESLDFSQQSSLRGGCFSWYSGVCEQQLEKMIDTANGTEPGPLRTQRMVEIADHVRDHYHFIPNFMNVVVYGLSERLEWTPYYAPRLRANTMSFGR